MQAASITIPRDWKGAPHNHRDLGEISRMVSGDIERVRDLIANRICQEETFSELLRTIRENESLDFKLFPAWLQPFLYDSSPDAEGKVQQISRHLLAQGGKLFRATLILLILKPLLPDDSRSPKLAAAMELIHLATLLHDDVIDHAEIRRGLPSLPAVFDNSPTVLMGDHLFARAFELIAECGNMDIISSSCRATSAMCRGEVEQLRWIGCAEVTEAAYFRLIEMKTAALMASCAESAALLAGHVANAGDWHRFGLTLGLIFQMTDDLLDFTGSQDVVGKQIGSDVASGKYTLPMIILRERLGGAPNLLRFLTANPSPAEIKEAFEKRGVLLEVRQRLSGLADTCHTLLVKLSEGVEDKEGFANLEELVAFVLERER